MANSSYSHEFLSNFGPAIPDYMLDFVQAPQMSEALKDVIAEKPGRKALDISNLDDARTAISGLMAQVEPTMVETPLGSFSPAKGVGAVFSALGGGPIAAGAGLLGSRQRKARRRHLLTLMHRKSERSQSQTLFLIR